MSGYTKQFFDHIGKHARSSAAAVVPIVCSLVKPRSIIDIGCGTGIWLSAFREAGVGDILGIDGDYVDRDSIEIPASSFSSMDLRKPIYLDRTFDLATCLEVAEHIPAEHAGCLVDSLSRLAPVVLFSAAVPGQGGADHVNEQWPEYWAARFRTNGYLAFDILRERLWEREEVAWWYAQNLVLYVRADSRVLRETLCGFKEDEVIRPLVHPGTFAYRLEQGRRLHQWLLLACKAVCEIADTIPPGQRFGLADEGRFANFSFGDRVVVPFPESEGVYAGLPPNDEAAIHSLKTLRANGVSNLVFTWDCFWWLRHYGGLRSHLDKKFDKTIETEHIVAYAI